VHDIDLALETLPVLSSPSVDLLAICIAKMAPSVRRMTRQTLATAPVPSVHVLSEPFTVGRGRGGAERKHSDIGGIKSGEKLRKRTVKWSINC
jgi:hypothetical protein